MEKKSDGKKFLPSSEDCPRCHGSHEALEFAFALIEAVADRVMKSEKYIDIFDKHGYVIIKHE